MQRELGESGNEVWGTENLAVITTHRITTFSGWNL